MDTLSLLENLIGKGRVKVDEPLSKYTTLKIGGKAQYFFIAQTQEELVFAYNASLKAKIPITIIGGGSNILISDKGLKGLIVRNQSRAIKVVKQFGKVIKGKMEIEKALVEADTGALINQLVRFCCDSGFAGLERHLGLPGTVGGALYMNSKWTKPAAYVGDVLYQAKVLNKDGTVRIVDKQYFNFAYDQSILQKTNEIVISAIFLLRKSDNQILWELAQRSMEYRKNTQPMGVATAGCTFRNISQVDALRIITPNNTTSAGYLVDQVKLKGFQIGKAKFSDKHANFILNLGGATSHDVYSLIKEAQKRVKEKFDVSIEPEIVLLGEFD